MSGTQDRIVAGLGLLVLLGGLASAGDGEVATALRTARQHLVAEEFRTALDLYRALAASELTDAERGVVQNNSCVCLIRLGEPERAVEACHEALRYRRRAGDRRGESRSLSNLAWAERRLGRLDDSERHYLQALRIADEQGDLQSKAITLDNLGTLHLRAGDFMAALRDYERAAATARSRPEAPWAPRQVAIAIVNQGTVLEKLGLHSRALELYDTLDSLPALPLRLRATATMNRGTHYRNLEMPFEAVRLYDEAQRGFAEVGYDEGRATALVNIALVQLDNLDRPAAAEPLLWEALELFEALGSHDGVLHGTYHLGRALTALGRLEEAERLHLEGLRRGDAQRSGEGRWSHRFGLGRVFEARRQPAAAWEHYADALSTIETLHRSLVDGVGDPFLSDKRPVFDAAVRVLSRLATEDPEGGHAERALEVIQQAKERELIEAIGRTRSARGPLPASEIRRHLGDAVLLEYYLGRTEAHLVFVERDAAHIHDLGDRRELASRVAAIHRQVSHLGPHDSEAMVELTGRIAPPLLGRTPPRRLYVSPDRELRYLAFDLLSDPGRPGELLVDTTEVVLLPSASALGGRPRSTQRPLRFTGIAAPGPATDPRADPLRGELGRLEHAVEEVRRAAASLGGPQRIALGDEATPDALLAALEEGTSVLHVAAHTVIDGGSASIRLSPTPDGRRSIEARTLRQLQIHNDLTVLASCSSAVGSAGDGSALATLTGGFLAAGASAVVATLWDVDDAATATFMEQFYHQLAAGRTPARALRSAKLRLRSDPRWSSPYHWAGYVVVGDTAPVRTPTGLLWLLVATAALVLAFALR